MGVERARRVEQARGKRTSSSSFAAGRCDTRALDRTSSRRTLRLFTARHSQRLSLDFTSSRLPHTMERARHAAARARLPNSRAHLDVASHQHAAAAALSAGRSRRSPLYSLSVARCRRRGLSLASPTTTRRSRTCGASKEIVATSMLSVLARGPGRVLRHARLMDSERRLLRARLHTRRARASRSSSPSTRRCAPRVDRDEERARWPSARRQQVRPELGARGEQGGGRGARAKKWRCAHFESSAKNRINVIEPYHEAVRACRKLRAAQEPKGGGGGKVAKKRWASMCSIM